MNMQQRKYLIKKRLEPLQQEANGAIRYAAQRFTKYTSWGDAVRMIQSGEIKLEPKFYHKSIHSGYIHSSYDNPFGELGKEILSKTGGVSTDKELREREQAEWDQRFKHATDFIMLASEDTVVALLHNLEASVKDYVKRAQETYAAAQEEEKQYKEWLEKEQLSHDY